MSMRGGGGWGGSINADISAAPNTEQEINSVCVCTRVCACANFVTEMVEITRNFLSNLLAISTPSYFITRSLPVSMYYQAYNAIFSRCQMILLTPSRTFTARS